LYERFSILRLVSKYDWLLFLHLLAAFSLVAALVMFWAITLASDRGPHPAIGVLAPPAGVMIQAGSVLTLVFGIWLAIDQYSLSDGWIIGAIVLWVIGVGAGGVAGRFFARAAEGGPDAATLRRNGLALHTLTSVAVLLLLIDMIYKPGA
jgi:hypothetical protein